MQKLTAISWLGVVTLAAVPAVAQIEQSSAPPPQSSTYVPGSSGLDSDASNAYAGRTSAVITSREEARGNVHMNNGRVVPQHGFLRRSDNQTRRPGSTNYTGSSLKGSHRPDVRSTGDDSSVMSTGSATRGPIRVRAGSSNEAGFALHPYRTPTATGGGPTDASLQFGRTADGQLEALAPSQPIQWGAGALGFKAPRIRIESVTNEDLAMLPSRHDGAGSTRPGLLAQDPTIAPSSFNDNDGITSARPVTFDARTQAFGGGPRDTRR